MAQDKHSTIGTWLMNGLVVTLPSYRLSGYSTLGVTSTTLTSDISTTFRSQGGDHIMHVRHDPGEEPFFESHPAESAVKIRTQGALAAGAVTTQIGQVETASVQALLSHLLSQHHECPTIHALGFALVRSSIGKYNAKNKKAFTFCSMTPLALEQHHLIPSSRRAHYKIYHSVGAG